MLTASLTDVVWGSGFLNDCSCDVLTASLTDVVWRSGFLNDCSCDVLIYAYEVPFCLNRLKEKNVVVVCV